jgi:hypothetical protein
MAFQEAFKVETKEGQPPLQVNAALFAENPNALAAGQGLAAEVETVSDTIQRKLNEMQKQAKDRWGMNGDEFRLAMLAMENELDLSVPDNFREVYKAAKTPEEAAQVISRNILQNVHNFMTATMREVVNKETGMTRRIPVGPSRADYIVGKAADISLMSVNKQEAVAFLKSIDPNITDQEVNNIWAKFDPGNAITDAGKAIARRTNPRADEAKNMR